MSTLGTNTLAKVIEDFGEFYEHGFDGTREHSSSNYEGTVWQCICGERFVEMSELEDHILPYSKVTDALGQDGLQVWLRAAYSTLLVSVREIPPHANTKLPKAEGSGAVARISVSPPQAGN